MTSASVYRGGPRLFAIRGECLSPLPILCHMNVTQLVDYIPARSTSMYLLMTCFAEQTKIVVVKRYVRVCNIAFRYWHNVMNNYARGNNPAGQTVLTESSLALDKRRPGFLPGLPFVESFCVWLHITVFRFRFPDPTDSADSWPAQTASCASCLQDCALQGSLLPSP